MSDKMPYNKRMASVDALMARLFAGPDITGPKIKISLRIEPKSLVLLRALAECADLGYTTLSEQLLDAAVLDAYSKLPADKLQAETIIARLMEEQNNG